MFLHLPFSFTHILEMGLKFANIFRKCEQKMFKLKVRRDVQRPLGVLMIKFLFWKLLFEFAVFFGTAVS